MRRIVLIVPGLVSPALRQDLPALRALTEGGTLFRLSPVPQVETPEALILGMRENEVLMRPGPLMVSALGADPPDKSTHFYLSLMSFDDGVATTPDAPNRDDLDALWPQVARLNTPKLTVLRGEGLDHALVWEALGEMRTVPSSDLATQAVKPNLPEGDGERMLRRFIDDSINLLSEQELNVRRVDAGLAPFNLLWPWGQGTRTKVPNLFLRRGERAVVESASLRMAGLTRLTGYGHGDRAAVGRGTATRFSSLADRVLAQEISIVLLEFAQDLSGEAHEEELHWAIREMDTRLLTPLLEAARPDPTQIMLLAPDESGGLGLRVVPSQPESNWVPFDERALDERGLPNLDLARQVELGVTL